MDWSQGTGVLVQPKAGLEFVLQDLEVDLRVARKLLIVYGARQFAKGLPHQVELFLSRFGGKVIKEMIEPMVAEAGGVERLEAKSLFEIILKEGLQLVVLRSSENGGTEQANYNNACPLADGEFRCCSFHLA